MITKKYEDFIIRLLDDGETWLKESLKTLTETADKRNIKALEVCDLSYNMVFKGISSNGPRVIKIGLPNSESLCEQHALVELNQDYMCRVYETEAEHCLTLMEGLEPGDTLWTIDFESRLEVAKDILANVPSLVENDVYPSHLGWIENVIEKLKKIHPKEHRIFFHLSEVLRLYPKLDHPYNPIMLLHGDLHHFNILKNGDGWKVIDPKGVYGHYNLEVGRYMLNQITEDGVDRDHVLKRMMDVFSKSMNLPKELIILSFYFDMTLSTAWTFEEALSDEDYLEMKLEYLEWLHEELPY